MKNCEVCGTLNLKENNYCTHCGCRIIDENICPYCGRKNPDSASTCINCGKDIFPIAIDNFDVFFSEHNRSLILNAKITNSQYINILNRIFGKLDYAEINGKTPKEKVLQIANVFAPTIPKSSGVVHGEYGINVIFYDDRLDDSLQISTIIHELAHFLLFDVSVNFLCEILDVKESSLIKSFIEYFLTVPEIEIINEYCAHTVENRFIPLEFQNFRSFEKCVMDMGLGMEDIVDFIILGNSYANDFIHFLERPINEKLRQSIKLQFKRDFIDSKKEIVSYADSRLFPIEEKNRLFIGLMAYSFESLYANEEARFELEHIRIKFED